jgi:ribonuclease-3
MSLFKKSQYAKLEKVLGYRFRKKAFLETALMHRSFRFENDGILSDNQRLEFLGDAVLGMVTAAHLYDVMPNDDEGKLTAFRSQMTNGKALAELAAGIGLGEFIKIGKGEEASGGRERLSNLADAFESVLGAAYLDGGIAAVEVIFKKVCIPQIASLSADVWAGNPKGKLQEYAQKKWKEGPRYRVTNKEGPAHEAIFTVEVEVPGDLRASGTGVNKRDAETDAAANLLKLLEIDI